MAETAKAFTTLELGADGGFQIPVSLKKISTRQDVEMDSASPDGNPMKQVDVDLHTGEIVERADKRRGVFRVKAKKADKLTWSDFAEISKADLDLIADATKIENFVVDDFIPLRDVPWERVTDAYFLAPVDGMSAKPLVLLARVLRKTKRAGVFKLVKTSRQHLAVVYEKDGGLFVNTLAWSGDFGAVREAAEALDRLDGKVNPVEVEVGVQLIEALSSDADVLDTFEDDLIPLKADLVERALAGESLTPTKKGKKALVTDDGLEAKLRESVAALGKEKVKA